ncbi:hypothetical protein RRG08_063078 [Elysia crispata]|uniref:Uncharacterized protein n=1 Tax=Elysia crispata TaxID=231223 RepID=A0AAE0Y4X4_9GAST|nr:hypothetical protein RRG08_063078 [Elysia crispata]
MATTVEEEAAGQKISTLCHHGNRTGRSARVKISTLCHHGNRTGRSCRSKDQYTLSPWQQNWKKLPE